MQLYKFYNFLTKFLHGFLLPRIAFPNPMGEGNTRNSIGCLKGPFKTGVVTNGADSGDGFRVQQIENNPAAFFTDVHSSLALPGAVRGQMDKGCY
jgi:hypothetical protein